MRPEDRLKELEERQQEIISFTNELEEKLRTKEISELEYRALLKKNYGEKTKEELMNKIHEEIKTLIKQIKKHKKTRVQLSITGIILILLAVISILTQNTPQGITGLVPGTREITQAINYNKTFNHYTETQLNLTNITSLKISGELEGTRAKIKLRTQEGTEYLVADITNPEQETSLITGLTIEETTNTTQPNTTQETNYTLTTNKKEYALGETIHINITPKTQNKSIYISYNNKTQKIQGETYTTQNTGEHQIIALIILPNNILRLETNITVTNTTEHPQTNKTTNTTINQTENQTINTTEETIKYEFSKVCIDTCTLPETSNPVLIIEPEENTTITITNITITKNKENNAPEQTKTIPDITINTEQETTLNLNNYFTDPDQDTIIYDINKIPEINTTIKQNTLIINSEQTGTYTAYIYATDGNKLITSNTFSITIIQSNKTTNKSINKTTNKTTNTTTNQTQTTTPKTNKTPTQTTDPCKNPNPNLRPPECMEGRETQYFNLENVLLENNKRSHVARITPLGNMIIRGRVIENSKAEPSQDDFKITTMNSDYELIPVAWIDTNTGDLHLKGNLYEEDYFLIPTPNAYVIQNKKNMNLAYIDRRTGDLHLKGNLVQNREVIR